MKAWKRILALLLALLMISAVLVACKDDSVEPEDEEPADDTPKAEEKEIDQNIAAVEDASPLSAEELAKIDHIRNTLGTQFCRRCNYCAPCAVGINIPMVLLVEGYLSRYGLSDWAAQRYATLDKKASDCIECGLC